MADVKPLSPALSKVIVVIDAITEYSGNLFAWILVPMALSVGYESTSAFIARFRQVLGTTPGRYYSASR